MGRSEWKGERPRVPGAKDLISLAREENSNPSGARTKETCSSWRHRVDLLIHSFCPFYVVLQTYLQRKEGGGQREGEREGGREGERRREGEREVALLLNTHAENLINTFLMTD